MKSTSVSVHPDEFTVVSVSRSHWPTLLQDNSLSPAGTAPFLIFSDPSEVTLVLNRADFENVRPGLGDSRFESGYRLVTFDAEMDLSIVGFLAEATRILAAAEVPVLALSSFSRDHLLIKQVHLAVALKALGEAVDALC